MNKLKTLKIKEKTFTELLKYTLQKQAQTGRRASYDTILHEFLQKGIIKVSLPQSKTEKLKKEIIKEYDVASVEEGIQKIIDEWLEKRRRK